MIQKKFRGVHAVTISTLLATSFLGACQTTNRYGADYSNDVCRAQRDTLQETGNHFAEDMVGGAVKGVLLGAVTGGLTAAATGGNIGKGLAIGAVAGGITGFGAGYFNSLAKQKGQDPTGLFAVFQGDMQRDAEQVAKSQAAFDALIDCRRREIDSVKVAVKGGSMPRKDGEARMVEIRQKISEDRRVAREIINKLEDRTSQYAVAGAKLGLPGAKATAEAAYNKKAKAGGASVEKPDLKLAVDSKAAQSAEAKKAGASFTGIVAGTADMSKKEVAAANLGTGDQFGNLGGWKFDFSTLFTVKSYNL
jgi:hypothetical protein